MKASWTKVEKWKREKKLGNEILENEKYKKKTKTRKVKIKNERKLKKLNITYIILNYKKKDFDENIRYSNAMFLFLIAGKILPGGISMILTMSMWVCDCVWGWISASMSEYMNQ